MAVPTPLVGRRDDDTAYSLRTEYLRRRMRKILVYICLRSESCLQSVVATTGVHTGDASAPIPLRNGPSPTDMRGLRPFSGTLTFKF